MDSQDRPQDTPRSPVEPSIPSSSTETALAPSATAGGGHPAHVHRPDHTPGTVIALATSVYQPLATMLDIIGQTLGDAPLLRYDKGRRPALVVDSGVSQAGERFCIALLFATFGGCGDQRKITDPIRRWLIPARPAGGACDPWPPWANVPVHNLGREMEFVISLPVNVYHIGVQAWACEPYVCGGKELWVSRGVAEALSHLADCNADALCKEVQTCPEYWGMLNYFNVTNTWKPRRRQQTSGAALSYERPEPEEEDDLHPAEEGPFPASPTSVLISLDPPTQPRSRSPTKPRSRSQARFSSLGSPEPRGFALEDCAAHDAEPGELFEDEGDEDDDILPTPFLVTPRRMDTSHSRRFDEPPSRRYDGSYSAHYDGSQSRRHDESPSGRYDDSPLRHFNSLPSARFDSAMPYEFPSTPSRVPGISQSPPRHPFSSPTRTPFSSSETLYSPLAPYSPLPADVPQTPVRRNGRTMDFEMDEGARQTGDFMAADDFMDALMADKFTTTKGYATTDDFMPVEGFTAAQNFTAALATPSLLERISTARTPKRRARNRRRNDNANDRRNDNNAHNVPITPRKRNGNVDFQDDANAMGIKNPNSIPLTPRTPLAPKSYTPHTPHSSKSSPYTPLKAPQLSSRGQRAFQPYPQFSPSKAYQQASPSKAAGRSLLDRLAVPPLKDRLAVPLKDRLASERKLADRISGAVVPSDD